MDELHACRGDSKLGRKDKMSFFIVVDGTNKKVKTFIFYPQLGNHDNPRVGSRYGTERIDALNAMLLTLPGAGVTYNVRGFCMKFLRVYQALRLL